ncbi:MAG: hypothetical protein WAV27_11800 [Xanthobacteraceae bacterium]|jgi:hypothetical protein
MVGLNQLAGLGIQAVMAIFLVVIHLGFASVTALASTMIPIVIAILQKVQTPGISVIGVTVLLLRGELRLYSAGQLALCADLDLRRHQLALAGLPVAPSGWLRRTEAGAAPARTQSFARAKEKTGACGQISV